MKVIALLMRSGLMVAGACLMFACTKPNVTDDHTNGAPVAAKPATGAAGPGTATTPQSQNPEDKMPRIKADEARKLVDDGKAVIIDVRGTEAYKTEHIKGALDIPLNKLESGDYKGLPKDKHIIAYCT
jgi:hypothetical protein